MTRRIESDVGTVSAVVISGNKTVDPSVAAGTAT
jgi:hypothetical protein